MKKMIAEFHEIFNDKSKMSGDQLKIVKTTTLLNALRSTIFECLCGYPCSTITQIAKRIRVSESSIRWHLKKLVNDGYVVQDDNGKAIFFPTNMIKPEHISILKVLASDKARSILALIIRIDGVNQTTLGNELNLNIRTVMKYVTELENFGMIESVLDGKYKRWHLTNLLGALRNYYGRRVTNFKRYILRRFKQDGLNPKIIQSTPEVLKLKISVGREVRTLRIHMNPFGDKVYRVYSIGRGRRVSKNSLIPLPLSSILEVRRAHTKALAEETSH